MPLLDPSELFPHRHFYDGALSGITTAVFRAERKADPGDAFELAGVRFTVTDVAEHTLGDLTDDDAQRLGYPSLLDFRACHAETDVFEFSWCPDERIVGHEIRKEG